MERTSPPTERVLQVLEAFAGAPGEPLNLATVVARTGLAPATCLGILNTLRHRGYLVRPGDGKTFVLGPAAIALGLAAQSVHATANLARDALRALSERWDCPATVSAIVDGHVTVLARQGEPIASDRGSEVGRRYPLRPPIGLLHLVWYPDARIEEWLAAPHVMPVREERERLDRVIATARSRGFVVERWTRTVDFDALVAAIGDDRIPPHVADLLSDYAATLGERDYVDEELDGADALQVSSVSAPVYDDRGEPVMLLLLYLRRDEMRADELARCAGDLVHATADLTDRLGGFDPWKAA